MGKRIELPKLPAGQTQEQLQALYSYLYQMAEALNGNLAEIGGNDLTDSEREIVREIVGTGNAEDGRSEAETLKSLIIKTADFVRTELNEYRMNLLGEYVAEGKFGKYVRRTGLNVDVTPTGIQQNYTFQEIIQGLKTYEVNAKNYIKTGLLRTVDNVPVYGVAIGKDIVTFSEDGTETYNDGNKVAELTADELSFWQNGNKVAGYTGSRVSFYYGGAESFYIKNGKIYCENDLKIASGKTFDLDSENFVIKSNPGYIKVINKPKTASTAYFSIGMNNAYVNPELGETWINIALAGYSISNVDTYPLVFSAEDRLSEPGIIHRTNMYFGPYYDNSAQRITSGIYALHGAYDESNPNSGTGSFTITCGEVVTHYIRSVQTITANRVQYLFLEQTSSRDVKHDIRDMEPPGDRLDQLRPVTFVYDDDPEERTRYGLIYEDTEPVLPEICTGDEGSKAINYVELIPMLLREIQELRARVKALEEREGGN